MAGGDGKAAANDTKGGAAAPPAQFQFAQKPEEKPGWEGFKQFLWNSETSEFLGRTGCSWCKYFIRKLRWILKKRRERETRAERQDRRVKAQRG